MRNYNLLWCIWVLWALLIILWLTQVGSTGVYLNRELLAVLIVVPLVALAFIYKIKKANKMLSFNKQKKSTPPQKELEETALLVLQTPLSPEQAAAQAELSDAIKPIRAKKDTFISNGTQFTGVLEVDGNIVVEGQVEGNIICAHIVRIENSGQVKGEIRAQQIMINGAVFGRCYSESLSIQPKGSVHGDIFADEISIEKGGIFIGQSQLMQKNLQEQQIPAKITPLKITTSATEHEVKLNKQNK